MHIWLWGLTTKALHGQEWGLRWYAELVLLYIPEHLLRCQALSRVTPMVQLCRVCFGECVGVVLMQFGGGGVLVNDALAKTSGCCMIGVRSIGILGCTGLLHLCLPQTSSSKECLIQEAWIWLLL